MISDYEKGGLRAPSINTMAKSLKLAWIPRLLSEVENFEDSWKATPNYLLDKYGGLNFLLRRNPYSFNSIPIVIQFNLYSFTLIPIVIQFNPYSFNSFLYRIHSIQFPFWFNLISVFIQFSFYIHSVQLLYSFNSIFIFILFNPSLFIQSFLSFIQFWGLGRGKN